MGVIKMGFEGQIFYGPAGSTGSTQIVEATDISYKLDTEKGNTTARGDGSASPIETQDVVVRKVGVEFTMLLKSTDTALEAIRTAAFAGTPLALRLKDYSAGKGFDGDVIFTVNEGKPLKGEQTLQFTADPTRNAGRSPQLYV